MSQNIAFIGGGNMATALIGGLLHQGWAATHITVVDPDPKQGERLTAKFGVRSFQLADEYLYEATAVVWAVKPQMMRNAVNAIAPFTGEAVHISIAAGIRIGDLAGWLGTNRIVRSMPNLPAIVRSGVTGAYAKSGLSHEDRNLAMCILASAGHVFWVESEEMMNAVTAVSGSGPGYVFHFLEGFQQAAEEIGFGKQQARELVLAISQGAVKLALNEAADLKELRDRVSSKGGTTVAGTNQLDARGSKEATIAAVKAAFYRAMELGSR